MDFFNTNREAERVDNRPTVERQCAVEAEMDGGLIDRRLGRSLRHPLS